MAIIPGQSEGLLGSNNCSTFNRNPASAALSRADREAVEREGLNWRADCLEADSGGERFAGPRKRPVYRLFSIEDSAHFILVFDELVIIRTADGALSRGGGSVYNRTLVS